LAEVLAKYTRLSAVNFMLRSIGEAEVPTLTAPHTRRGDVISAVTVLDEEGRSFQSEGWWFNMERTTHPIVVSSAGNNEILIGDTILDIKNKYYTPEKVYVEKAGKLYNRTDNTFIFTSGVELITTYLIQFEDLPEVARRYVTLRAARVLSETRVGDPQLRQYATQVEGMARAKVEESQSEHESFNVFKDSEASELTNRGLR